MMNSIFVSIAMLGVVFASHRATDEPAAKTEEQVVALAPAQTMPATLPADANAPKPTPGILPVEPTPAPSASAEPKATATPEPKATPAATPTATATPAAPTPSATASASPATKPAADAIKLTAMNHGKSVSAAVGQKIIVTLSGNPTTGFNWALTKIDGPSVKESGKMEYVQDDAKGKVGVGGKFTFTFEAVKAGKSTVTLDYKRPFEKTAASAMTFTVDVK